VLKTVIEQEFDAIAPVYENNGPSQWYQAHEAEMLTVCNPLKEVDILDIGCGTGHFLRQYLKQNPQARGVGLDLSSSMIDEAKNNADAEGIENVSFYKGDWEEVDAGLFRPYNFSLIVCANAFHYFADPQAAAEKMYHLLSDGGTLKLLERDKSRSLLTYFWGFLHRNCIKDHVVYYGKNELLSFYEKSGFINVRVIRTIRRYFWKKKLFTSIVLIECDKISEANYGKSDITGRKTGADSS